MVKRISIPESRHQHIRSIGITSNTRQRYHKALAHFFSWLRTMSFGMPHDMDDFDYLAGEFVNHLWQEGCGLSSANDFISGMGRFFPKSRRNMPTARQYVKNWCRQVSRKRALPLSIDMVKAMAALALMRSRRDLSVLLLLGFLGLLRTDELLQLRRDQIIFLHKPQMRIVITLLHTKTTGYRGGPEQVVIHDPVVHLLLQDVVQSLNSSERIYNGSFATLSREYRWLAGHFGLARSRLTLYGLRRGGATWHFLNFGNWDALAERGRWSQVRTARLYVEGAAAELTDMQISERGRRLVTTASRLLPHMISTRRT